MDWKYAKPLTSKELIHAFEVYTDYKLPEDFKACVLNHNGGRPSSKTFDTHVTTERALKSLLSFNKDDRENIWKVNDWNTQELKKRFVAFAIDNFGNLICFDQKDNSVIFLETENLQVEKVAKNFTAFLNMLYEPE